MMNKETIEQKYNNLTREQRFQILGHNLLYEELSDVHKIVVSYYFKNLHHLRRNNNGWN